MMQNVSEKVLIYLINFLLNLSKGNRFRFQKFKRFEELNLLNFIHGNSTQRFLKKF